jgi:hypothetical protein
MSHRRSNGTLVGALTSKNPMERRLPAVGPVSNWNFSCGLSAADCQPSASLFPEKFLDRGELGFGHIQIFLGPFAVLFLHGRLCFCNIRPHALLSGDDVAAKAVASGRLLALKIIQGLRDGAGAAVDVVVAMFVFLDERGFFRFGLSGGIIGLRVPLGFGRGGLLWRRRRISRGRCWRGCRSRGVRCGRSGARVFRRSLTGLLRLRAGRIDCAWGRRIR